MKSRDQRRLDKINRTQMLIERQAELQRVMDKYPVRTPWGTFTDWLAVYVAFQSFIFLVAWQAYPEWDDTQIWPTFIRAALVALPITLGMWGVARALRAGSAVPRDMAKHIPYGKVGGDGSVGGTTTADEEAGNPPEPLNSDDAATDDNETKENQ